VDAEGVLVVTDGTSGLIAGEEAKEAQQILEEDIGSSDMEDGRLQSSRSRKPLATHADVQD
jgi:hypothetical protein